MAKVRRQPDPDKDWQFLAQPKRCAGTRRHGRGPCTEWASPFQIHCRYCGSTRKSEYEKARRAMLNYERFTSDPGFWKTRRLLAWRNFDRSYQMRRAKRLDRERGTGTFYQDQLRAEWEFNDLERKQAREDEVAARRKLREERRQQMIKEARIRNPKPRPKPQPPKPQRPEPQPVEPYSDGGGYWVDFTDDL